jgi:hypothetical protein
MPQPRPDQRVNRSRAVPRPDSWCGSGDERDLAVEGAGLGWSEGRGYLGERVAGGDDELQDALARASSRCPPSE